MKSWLKTNRGFILFLLCFGVFRTAIADWNPIPSGSMHPNLLEGDVVFVNRLAYDLKLPLTDIVLAPLGEPKRGEIVTFSSPQGGTRLIKRIIGVPGDKVEMRNEILYINDQRASYSEQALGVAPENALQLTETVADSKRRMQVLPSGAPRNSFGPVTVPPDHYLMLGDNRDNSADSRYFGFVERKLLIGQANRILVSADILANWAPRFDRFGKALQ
ncbi:MAG: signal peptidase I [Burkholderiales bacterium]|nr:signal peptidase I [Burkholderiales bacterium]